LLPWQGRPLSVKHRAVTASSICLGINLASVHAVVDHATSASVPPQHVDDCPE
jgi:hypothetical protein